MYVDQFHAYGIQLTTQLSALDPQWKLCLKEQHADVHESFHQRWRLAWFPFILSYDHFFLVTCYLFASNTAYWNSHTH
jgi:hypothetical protein